MSILKAIQIKKYYGDGENIVRALDGIDLEVKEGEFLAIVGYSGSGKSTLLHILSGLEKPTKGSVIIQGKDISKMNDDEITIFRRRNVGFIFQNYNLIPILNVYENVVLPLELDGGIINKNYIDEILIALGIKDKAKTFPNKLSGGEQQRVAIARALASRPSIIFADEPTGNLDSKTEQEVIGLLRRTSQKFNQTIVMITHNQEISQVANRVIRIEDGKLVK